MSLSVRKLYPYWLPLEVVFPLKRAGRWMDGWTDRWTDRQMDGQTLLSLAAASVPICAPPRPALGLRGISSA